jgi:hypothetical protein
MTLPPISVQLVVGASAGSVTDSSPLLRLARPLLDLDGPSGKFIHTQACK